MSSPGLHGYGNVVLAVDRTWTKLELYVVLLPEHLDHPTDQARLPFLHTRAL